MLHQQLIFNSFVGVPQPQGRQFPTDCRSLNAKDRKHSVISVTKNMGVWGVLGGKEGKITVKYKQNHYIV